VFLVTDKVLADLGFTDKVTRVLEDLGVDVQTFAEVEPDPTLGTVLRGVERMKGFAPDTILALGGSQHPRQVFTAFRGREATIAALLRHTGLAA